jgi:RNA polymerase sigma-70 factor (ECF subfamily)
MKQNSEAIQGYAGDLALHDEFQRLTSPFQHELLVHCYRFFGSLDEAEDALQETWLRAWRRLDSLKDQNALRAWLYRIATNVSLDMLDKHKTRSLPSQAYPPADPREPLPGPASDPLWIDPLPEEYLDWQGLNPEARIELSESVSLAFLTVLQILPGRQRAVLILRDVLGWKAGETAELLNLSLPAVNSALQRARATLKKHRQGRTAGKPASTLGEQVDTLLERYIQAWETADSNRLVSLLREDAVWTMPPLPTWYSGVAAIQAFLNARLFVHRTTGDVRLAAVRANGCPAFAVYQREAGGAYHIGSLQILSIENNEIVRIDSYIAPGERLLDRFKLPSSL